MWNENNILLLVGFIKNCDSSINYKILQITNLFAPMYIK